MHRTANRNANRSTSRSTGRSTGRSTSRSTGRSTSGGFTLIELMIVTAIIGILAALAWPSYARHVTRVRRVEGQTALIEAMQQQERFQSQHNSYIAFSATATDSDAQTFRWWSGHDAAGSAYELDAHACADATIADCVEIRARPGTERVDTRFHDPDCGELTLDSLGRQGAQQVADPRRRALLAMTTGSHGARRTNQRRGVTLVELLVVLAVLGIVLALGAPDLGRLVRRQQLKAASGEMFAAVGLARAQALARGRVVVVAPIDAAGSDWRSGWRVFVDHDGDGRPGPGDELIAEHAPLAPGITVDFAFTSTAPPRYIAYNGAGRGCSAANPATARLGTLSLFQDGAIRRIKINMLGRARLCDPARDTGCDGADAPS